MLFIHNERTGVFGCGDSVFSSHKEPAFSQKRFEGSVGKDWLLEAWERLGPDLGGGNAPLGAGGSLFPSTQLSSQNRADNLLERSGNWPIRPYGMQAKD